MAGRAGAGPLLARLATQGTDPVEWAAAAAGAMELKKRARKCGATRETDMLDQGEATTVHVFSLHGWTTTGVIGWKSVLLSSGPGLLVILLAGGFARFHESRTFRLVPTVLATFAAALSTSCLVLFLWGFGGDHESPHNDHLALFEEVMALPAVCALTAWRSSRSRSKLDLFVAWLWGVLVLLAIDQLADDGSEGAIQSGVRWKAIVLLTGALVAIGAVAVETVSGWRRRPRGGPSASG